MTAINNMKVKQNKEKKNKVDMQLKKVHEINK